MEPTTRLNAGEAAASLSGAGSVVNMVGKIALPLMMLGMASKVLDWANGSPRAAAQPEM